jgi:hypothetical protein
MRTRNPIPRTGVHERGEARRRRLLVLAAGALVAGLVGTVAHSQVQSLPASPSASPSASAAPGSVGVVPFDHRTHAGKYGMPCLSCHVYADKTPVAGLPSGKKCMGCHKFVAKENAAVQVLAARVAAGESLRWERVFFLPEYIYFSHRMHVRADVACSECHGDVVRMATVTQDRPFSMGGCLSCHDQRQATRECVACHK